MGPYESDPSGMEQVSYVPATAGNYTATFNFPGELVFNTTFGGFNGRDYLYNAYFTPTTESTGFTVQQTPITGYQEAPVPLPTQYWSSPINAQNRGWNIISGPLLQSTTFYNNSYAPNSPHILYTMMPNPIGGLIGGAYGSLEFQRSSGFSIVAIMGGDVFYQGPSTPSGTPQLYCMNLATGKQLWSTPAPISVSMGQILNWRSLQSKIEIPYLWSLGSTYTMYNAENGQSVLNFTGATSGTAILSTVNPLTIGTDVGGASGGGGLLVYMIGYLNATYTPYPNAQVYPIYSATQKFPQQASYGGFWVACWNATQAIGNNWKTYISNSSSSAVFMSGGKSIYGTNIPWNLGLEWNVSYWGNVAPGFAGTYGDKSITEAGVTQQQAGTNAGGIKSVDDKVVLVSSSGNFSAPLNLVTWAAFDVNTGATLWIKNYTCVPGSQLCQPNGLGNGIFTYWIKENETLNAYSELTGNLVWSINPASNDFSVFDAFSGTYAYGNLYVGDYDGYMHSINVTTGQQNWATLGEPGGLEMPEQAYPMSGAWVADGKVFTSTTKSYETEPLYRGHFLYAFDANTGAQLWNISGQYTGITVNDGYMLANNNYDSNEYFFGMGQTATTVSAPQTAITSGSSAIIQGTVTDQSPGKPGTPAVSDASMSAWMAYLYMDQPMSTHATGVPVSIDAVDPNGNFVHIGNATSDLSGTYIYKWTPPNIPGTYTIVATFAGSNSYYSSSAETGAVVVSSPAATAAPTPTPTSVADMYFVPAIAGIIVLIIIVLAVVILLMLRKRP